MNPRAAVNDLLPFQGSPFGQLGYFSKLSYLPVIFGILFYCCHTTNIILTHVLCIVKHFFQLFFKSFFQVSDERREWDSNPRALADKRFSRPPRYDHFDISPYAVFCIYFVLFCQRMLYSITIHRTCQQHFSLFLHFFI